jgi:hypothetical protein
MLIIQQEIPLAKMAPPHSSKEFLVLKSIVECKIHPHKMPLEVLLKT